jgi:hypothetical protein
MESDMWYIQSTEGFTRDELLKLYKFSENREKAYRDELYRFVNFYSAVCYAVLGLTLSGFYAIYTQKGNTSLLLLFGPMLAFLICALGIRVAFRTYNRIIEEISVKAKLEHLLGLDQPIRVMEIPNNTPIWTEDSSLISTRHAKRRCEESNSDTFIVTSSQRGLYREIRIYFGIIAFFTLVLTVIIMGVRFF